MLFVFDWDGTLCDSVAKIVRCLRVAAERAGQGSLAAHRAQQVIGLSLPEAIGRLFPGVGSDKVDQIARLYREAFLSDATPAGLFHGVEETLAVLRARGHRLAVATGKARVGLDQGLSETGLAGRFCATRCADETASKPDPTMLLELLDQLQFAPRDAVMVGDTTFDLEMASAAGMRSIGVSYGCHGVPELQACQPELIVDSVAALLHWSES